MAIGIFLGIGDSMADSFERPDFSTGQVEFRVDDNGVAIYGTRDGLRRLAGICNELAARPANNDRTDHVHLEDHGILTKKSNIAAVAYFD
jgi:hypothetical protein